MWLERKSLLFFSSQSCGGGIFKTGVWKPTLLYKAILPLNKWMTDDGMSQTTHKQFNFIIFFFLGGWWFGFSYLKKIRLIPNF